MSSVYLLDAVQAAEDAINSNLTLPDAAPDGRTNALNDYGGSYRKMGEFTEHFVATAKEIPNVKILEVGPAFGEGCLNIFQQCDVADYTAIDPEAKHLKIVARRVREECAEEKLRNLTLIVGKFPEVNVIKLLKEGYYDFVLTENVIHFFTTEELYEVNICMFIRNFRVFGCFGNFIFFVF